jgi:2-polyprenyl-6-methoxyphenol hydroxylase-like FAD-dependent oxidoreductase
MSAIEPSVTGGAVSRVLIVGGGVSGLALANGLAAAGIHVEVVERNPRTSGSAIGLWSFSVRAFEKLGLKDELLAAGAVSEKLETFDPRGNLVQTVDYAEIPIAPGQPAQVMVSRPALAAMFDRVARARGAHIRHHVTFETVHETKDGVEVTFTDGTSGKYDLLVGADGVFSTVRRELFGNPLEPRRAATGNWQTTVPNKDLGIRNPVYWVGEGSGSFMLYPSGLDRCATGLSDTLTERPPTPEAEKARVCELLSAFDVPQARYVQQLVEAGEVVMEFRRVHWLLVQPPWFRGRMVLVGDAVHASPPNLGGGASMAVEDAAVLADALIRHDSLPDALANYMARRWARIENVYNKSYRAKVMSEVDPGKYFSVNSPILREVLASLRVDP